MDYQKFSSSASENVIDQNPVKQEQHFCFLSQHELQGRRRRSWDLLSVCPLKIYVFIHIHLLSGLFLKPVIKTSKGGNPLISVIRRIFFSAAYSSPPSITCAQTVMCKIVIQSALYFRQKSSNLKCSYTQQQIGTNLYNTDGLEAAGRGYLIQQPLRKKTAHYQLWHLPLL